MSQKTSNPETEPKARGWSIIAAGLLLLALALVVLYTTRSAFSSPTALVVIAAIGLAALLIKVRLDRQVRKAAKIPVWLNAIGLLCAVAAVFADKLHFKTPVMLAAAFAAVFCFGISGTAILRDLRKKKPE